MSLICACPPATAITAITLDNCEEYFGQIQRAFFQRTKSSSTTNVITIASTNPNLLATWTDLKAATDSTKVVTGPKFGSFILDEPGPREQGSGNEVPGGIPISLGNNPSTATGRFINISQASAESIKLLRCERKNTSVFLITESGLILGLGNTVSSPTTFRGIPIRSLFIGDKFLGGFDGYDYNPFSWRFLPEWSSTLYAVTPSDFDALEDL